MKNTGGGGFTIIKRADLSAFKNCFHLGSRKAYLGFNVLPENSGGIFCFFAELAYFCTLFNQISFSTMKQIDVGRGMFALVDDCDLDVVAAYKWRAMKGKFTYYAVSGSGAKTILMHRLILGLQNRGKICDHENGNGLDNTRSNLRVCTYAENNRNKRGYKNSTSNLKGVRKISLKKWCARITHGGRVIYLGIFENEIEAAKAYNKKAKELHGEFAFLNQV